MVFCALCKQNKDTLNKWTIRDHAVDNSILNELKVCDDCAIDLLKKLYVKEGEDPKQKLSSLNLIRLEIIENIGVSENKALEVTLSMDFAQVRKLISEQLNQK
ncbi:MAG: hypothetical protein QW735_02250 [archaeon]